MFPVHTHPQCLAGLDESVPNLDLPVSYDATWRGAIIHYGRASTAPRSADLNLHRRKVVLGVELLDVEVRSQAQNGFLGGRLTG